MSKALGIINFSGNHIWVKGLQSYRPIGAMSFLGRYRVIDFPLSNMSNSGIDQIQVYINQKPRYSYRTYRNRKTLQYQLQTWKSPKSSFL